MLRTPLFLSVLLTLVLTLQLASTANCQWVRQSPFPTGADLWGVYFTSPSEGYICGSGHTLMKTTDGGLTWKQLFTSTNHADQPYYAVYFTDVQHGFVSGSSFIDFADIWRTSDAGNSWTQPNAFPVGGSWYHIDFISPSVGFMGSNGALVRSTDGGLTWLLRSGYPSCPVIYGMDFQTDLMGVAAGYSLEKQQWGIWKTVDGGVTWTNKLPIPSQDVLFMDENTVIALADGVYRSTDQGETWSQIAAPLTDGPSVLARVDDQVICGVSSKGDIWRCSDGGYTWLKIVDGIGALPAHWHISFSDAQNGWVVGQSGFLYKTTNGGLTWAMMNNGAGIQLYDIEMASDDYGYAIGYNGYLFRTLDGGERWDVRKLEVTGQIFGRDEGLEAVSVVDRTFAVAAGPGGTVFKTEDGGENWLSIGYPGLSGEFWIHDVKFVSRSEGWIAGVDYGFGNNSLFHTTDSGATWDPVDLGFSYTSIDFVDRLHGWLAPGGKYILRTTDGGDTWQQRTLPDYFTSPNVSQIRFADQKTGWVMGWYGYTAKTENGGLTWSLQNVGGQDLHILGFSVVSPKEVWATGRDGSYRVFVLHTTDGGTTWTRENIADWPFSLSAVSAHPKGSIWLAGSEGRILKHSPSPKPSLIPKKR